MKSGGALAAKIIDIDCQQIYPLDVGIPNKTKPWFIENSTIRAINVILMIE